MAKLTLQELHDLTGKMLKSNPELRNKEVTPYSTSLEYANIKHSFFVLDESGELVFTNAAFSEDKLTWGIKNCD